MLSAGGRPHLSQASREVSLRSCIRACALEKEGDGERAPRGEKRRWRGAVMGEGVRVKPRKGSRQTVAAKRSPASPRASGGPGPPWVRGPGRARQSWGDAEDTEAWLAPDSRAAGPGRRRGGRRGL